MKLKKIVLQKSHKVMTPVEMKGIIGGQITKSRWAGLPAQMHRHMTGKTS